MVWRRPAVLALLVSSIAVIAERRLVLQNPETDILTDIANLKADVANLKVKLAQKDVEILQMSKAMSSTYIRWGRTTCPGNGSQIVYKGYSGGSPYVTNGGTADFVCLPDNPTWGLVHTGKHSFRAYMDGAQYEVTDFNPFPNINRDDDVPCVVCQTIRPTTLMIPARTNCYPGWTMEYTGYLMAGYYNDDNPSNYVCVDSNPEAEYRSSASKLAKTMVFVEVECYSLPCGPYVAGHELACVVCSR